MFLRFAQWLETTSWSIALHESLYMYSLVETTHVLTLCLFLGLIAMWDLRLLDLMMRGVPAAEVGTRLLPWALAGFVVMVVTGGLLFYAIPVRTYHSIFFRAKLLMMALAGLNALLFHTGTYRTAGEWKAALGTPIRAKVAGAVSLTLWTGIVVSGRMIAYDWFDCGKPQPAIVNLLASCRNATENP